MTVEHGSGREEEGRRKTGGGVEIDDRSDEGSSNARSIGQLRVVGQPDLELPVESLLDVAMSIQDCHDLYRLWLGPVNDKVRIDRKESNVPVG